MRILVVLVLSFLASFYLSEFLRRAWKVTFGRKRSLFPFPHSLVGFFLLALGILCIISGGPILGDPYHILLGNLLIGSGLGVITHHILAAAFVINQSAETRFARNHEYFIQRCLEILPGALTWIALTSPIWLSFALPFAVAYLILLADIYWFVSAVRIAILISIGYRKMRWAEKQPWQENLKKDFPNEYNKYYHLIILPTYKESLEILEPTFDAIANSSFPHKQIYLGIGFEAWDDPDRVAVVEKFLKQNEHRIGGIFITHHELKPNEVKGPGTNRNCIVVSALEEFQKLKIDPKYVLATTLDADFVIHPEFLAGALHKYLTLPEDVRFKRSLTGVFIYNNNYWQAPTPMRVIATGTSFWQISEMVGSDKYIHFASLSINLQTLKDVGMWLPDKVNDDSGFYWKNYYFFDGDYKVVPHFIPISADAVLDTTLFKTFQNQYLQLKRWAYGVEHIPFIFKEYFKKTDMDFWDKTDKLTFIMWSYFKWGTLALFITFGGLFIPLANPAYAQSVVYYNLSVVSSWILTAAFLGLFSTVYFNEKVAPPRPKNWSLFKKTWSYIQWILVPIVLVSITTIPAIDAQTSLMFRRYLEFRVTNKAR